jgi:hypothetical protein
MMKSRIVNVQGNPLIEIDGRCFIPAAFRSYRPMPANIAQFYRSGIRLFQFICSGRNNTLDIPYSLFGEIWQGNDSYDFAAFDRQIEMFMQYAPEGYFMVMITLDMPRWWLDSHPGQPDSYYQLGQAAVDKVWITEATKYLQAFILYAEEKYGNRIFGYSFSAGKCTEWFDQSLMAPTAEKQDDYRQWSGVPNTVAPTATDLQEGLPNIFRDPDNNVAKYLNYCCDRMAELILHFARAAQAIIRHEKLLGIFLGYIDMSSINQNLWATNGYEQVWQSEDIDLFFSPAAYRHCRHLDGASSYQQMVDSIELNGKLFLHEIDHRTHLAKHPLENGKFLGDCYRNEFESIMVLRRELCAAACKGSALWWFDFITGYYASPTLEAEVSHHVQILDRLRDFPRRQVAEIAVFVDPRSFLLLNEQADLHPEYVRHNLYSLHECGAPFCMFNQNDLTKIDLSQYKLVVFLNAFSIPEPIRKDIDERLTNQLKVWIHAPDISRPGCSPVERVSCRAGMQLKAYSSDIAEEIRFEDLTYGFGKPVVPLFEVNDSQAEVLGRYQSTGRAALAMKENNVYSALSPLPHQLWRSLARRAGVHIYCEGPGAFYVDSRFVARQTVHEEQCEIYMPFDCEVEELFDGGVYTTRDKVIRYQAKRGETKLFLIRRKE